MIKEHVDDMAKGLRHYTGLCSWLEIERMAEGEPKTKPSPTENIILGGLYWYAANPSTKKICRKQEFSRLLFNSTTKEQLAGKLQQWFTLEEIRPVLSSDATADGFEFFEDGARWLPIDWKSASTVLVLISIGVAIVAVFALCAILVFRSKHKGNHKRGRSMPRNYPSVYPKYNDNVYLPNLGNGAHFIGNPIGTEERTNKFYETQMLELQ
uniref:Uncharacterized protein n=1 Tax=Ditylenchus dipsaci TaxID=166011 RepID=A0A915D1N0_9BILA